MLRRLNGYCLAKLHAAAEAVRAEGGQALCIDEAACIDAALREVAWRGDDLLVVVTSSGIMKSIVEAAARGDVAVSDL